MRKGSPTCLNINKKEGLRLAYTMRWGKRLSCSSFFVSHPNFRPRRFVTCRRRKSKALSPLSFFLAFRLLWHAATDFCSLQSQVPLCAPDNTSRDKMLNRLLRSRWRESWNNLGACDKLMCALWKLGSQCNYKHIFVLQFSGHTYAQPIIQIRKVSIFLYFVKLSNFTDDWQLNKAGMPREKKC